jgi:hypothetical protein
MCDNFRSQLKSDAFIGSKYEGLCHRKKVCLILIIVHCNELCVMMRVSSIEVNSASCILSVFLEILWLMLGKVQAC